MGLVTALNSRHINLPPGANTLYASSKAFKKSILYEPRKQQIIKYQKGIYEEARQTCSIFVKFRIPNAMV